MQRIKAADAAAVAEADRLMFEERGRLDPVTQAAGFRSMTPEQVNEVSSLLQLALPCLLASLGGSVSLP